MSHIVLFRVLIFHQTEAFITMFFAKPKMKPT